MKLKGAKRLVAGLSMLLLWLPVLQVSAHEKQTQSTNSMLGMDSAAAKAVSSFNQALQQGNGDLALALLADNAQIFEGGSVEHSAQEYATHHLSADIAYLAKVQVTVLEQQVYVEGDLAFSRSRTHSQGRYKERDIDSDGLETMVLQRQAGNWKIIHIHWSH